MWNLGLGTRTPGKKTASYFVAAGRRRPLSLRGPVFVLARDVMMIRITEIQRIKSKHTRCRSWEN